MAITGFVSTEILDPQPKWMPDHKGTLWHTGLNQEVRILGVIVSATIIQYRTRIVNSTDNREYIALEFQLKEMSEAETVDSTLKINKAPWAAIKEVLLTFLSSYPVTPEVRSSLENQVKSRNKGIATSLIDERGSTNGNFMGSADLINRMKQRNDLFPWDAIADQFDYST